ncbi:MAG: transcriptional repressor [Alphaproteobacteria bacterium]|nr:transcriptional repressor [Alphaproteobacteria bacterium]MDE2111864.1 transcriptional repressor [Alphaproteobacteria bacterium]MDE2493604.1 transcriptional repressor [Alphaproteobacteria bacterium]
MSKRKLHEPMSEIATVRLRQAKLRPTRQRAELAELLFHGGHRHLTADALHAEAAANGARVSLATIYNTLHQFTKAGLLREVVVNPTHSYFDTNTTDHQHFYCEDDDTLIDIVDPEFEIRLPRSSPPETEIKRIDVVVQVRRR